MNGIEYLWLRDADGIKPEDRRRFYHVPETKTFWEWALTCNRPVTGKSAGGGALTFDEDPGVERVPRGAVLRFPRTMVTSTAATVPGLVLTALLYRHLDMQQSGDFGHANVYTLTNIMKRLEGFDGVSEREAAYRILPVLDSLTKSGVLEFWALMAQNPDTKKWNKVPKNIKNGGLHVGEILHML